MNRLAFFVLSAALGAGAFALINWMADSPDSPNQNDPSSNPEVASKPAPLVETVPGPVNPAPVVEPVSPDPAPPESGAVVSPLPAPGIQVAPAVHQENPALGSGVGPRKATSTTIEVIDPLPLPAPVPDVDDGKVGTTFIQPNSPEV